LYYSFPFATDCKVFTFSMNLSEKLNTIRVI